MSHLILNEFKLIYAVTNYEDLLEADDGYFFNNLFAKLRYFATGMSDKHVHLCLISLKDYAPSRMASVLIQLLELVGKNIDSAMLLLDQAKILQAMDALVTLTDFIHKEAGQDSKILPGTGEETTEESKMFQNDRTGKSLPNMLRRLLLRIQPYMSPSTNPGLAYKAL